MRESVIHFWYQALASPLGISVVVNDIEALRARLYAARKEAQDTDLAQIAICLSPFDPQKLWLVKRAPNGGPNAQT